MYKGQYAVDIDNGLNAVISRVFVLVSKNRAFGCGAHPRRKLAPGGEAEDGNPARTDAQAVGTPAQPPQRRFHVAHGCGVLRMCGQAVVNGYACKPFSGQPLAQWTELYFVPAAPSSTGEQ